MGVGEPTKILFGTDGWRAKIGDEYTFENVRRLAEGVARVVEEDGTTAKSVVIAYDRPSARKSSRLPPPKSCSRTASPLPTLAPTCQRRWPRTKWSCAARRWAW